jgi:AAHS family 3-hydroxyphenylpropionic acid transporter
MMSDDPAIPRRILRPKLLIFAMILGIFDGADIASIGLTLSRISRDLALDPAQGGLCASASMFGLMIGAIVGGRLADTRGRKPVMLVSMVLLGTCSLGTALAWDFPSLLMLRLFAGLGMGGLMPVLIAVAGDAASSRFRATAISILMASGGVGAATAGMVALHPDWQMVFYYGAFGPLAMLPVIAFWLKDTGQPAESSHGKHRAENISLSASLLGGGRATGSLLIWAIAFATALAGYVLINWLPSLLVRQGVDEQISHSAMIAYSVGGIFGNIAAGLAMDRGATRATYVLGYMGAVLCVLGLAVGINGVGIYALCFGVNFFMLAGQLATFSLTSVYYPVAVRASGIGAMVSAGRLGSVIGPLAVGLLLHGGFEARLVLLGLIPAYLLALALGLAFERLVRGRVAPPILGASLVGAK